MDKKKDTLSETKKVVKEEAEVAAEKITKAAKVAAEKINDVKEEIIEKNEKKPIVTSETINRVTLALIIVVAILVLLKVFGIYASIAREWFGNNDKIEDSTEIYVSNLFKNANSDDIDCDVVSSYSYGYVLECELDSFTLKNQFGDHKVFVGASADRNPVYCLPKDSKREIKKCLKGIR